MARSQSLSRSEKWVKRKQYAAEIGFLKTVMASARRDKLKNTDIRKEGTYM
jgi:hypothetical protein